MVSLDQLLSLTLASVLIIAVPGPSVLFVVGRALSYGRATALASVAGNAVGCYVVALAIALGVGPLLERSSLAFHAIRLAGAAYLIVLGVRALRHSRREAEAASAVAPGSPDTWAAVRTGVLVGVTNPKAFILFGAILPQFVDRESGSVPLQMTVLALAPILVGLLSDSGWALAAGGARAWFARAPRRLVTLGRLGGVSLVGLGVTMMLQGGRE